jgi:hypothetical protein
MTTALKIATIRHLPISTIREGNPSRTGTQANTNSRMVARRPRRDITNTHMAVQRLRMDIASIHMKVDRPKRDTVNAPTMVRRHPKDIVNIRMVVRLRPRREAIPASISHLSNTIAAHPLPARTQCTLTPKGSLPFQMAGFLNGTESISAGTTLKKPQDIPSGRHQVPAVLITAAGARLETMVTLLMRIRVMVATATPLTKTGAMITMVTGTHPGMTRMATIPAIIPAMDSTRPGATASTPKQLQ